MDRETALAIKAQIEAENDVVTAAVALGELYVTQPEFYAALHGEEIAPGIHIQNPGPDAARMTDKYVRRTQAAAQDYVVGMQNPRRDPVQAAVRASGKWANRVQEAINNRLYERGVRGQNYQEAVQIAISDGGAAFTQGVAKRESKVSRVFQDLAPRLGAVSQQIQSMPQDTEAQREQRLITAVRAMRAIGKARKGAGTTGGVIA